MPDTLTIPPFLRRHAINAQLLEQLILSLGLAYAHLRGHGPESLNDDDIEMLDSLIEQLVWCRDGRPNNGQRSVNLPKEEVVEIDPATIKLDAKLKERVGFQIVGAIKDGHNTFAQLRKALPMLRIGMPAQEIEMPDRVLKSALGHALRRKLPGVRVEKVSPKRYGVID